MIPCAECIYRSERCFPILRASTYLGYVCKQGRAASKKKEKQPVKEVEP